MRLDPYILQNGGAFGDEVAAEGIVSVERVREVDGGYGPPAQYLQKLGVISG